MKIRRTEKRIIFDTIKKKIRQNSNNKIDKKKLIEYLLSKYNRYMIKYVVEELVKLQRLSLVQDKDEMYRLRNKITSSQLKPLTINTQKVYLIIENSETKGMWLRTIVKSQYLPYRIVYKSIKTLEKLGLIKRLFVTNRKNYISTIYFKEEKKSLEKTFYRKISSYTRNYFTEHVVQNATLVEIYDFLFKKGKTIHLLSNAIEDNIKILVFSIICEGKILPFPITSIDKKMEYESQKDSFLNKLSEKTKLCINTRPVYSNFAFIPCCSCDLGDVCYKGNNVNPEGCKYLSVWLDGF